MEKQKVRRSKTLSEEKLNKIKRLTMESFSKIGSDSYRQKLVYNLLNVIKSDNQREFFDILLRALNSQKDNVKAKELVKELGDVYPITHGNFEKLAYSIVMGIMAAKSVSGGE